MSVFKLPKSLAACADLYADLRDKRLEMQKEVDKVKEQEQQVKDYLINNLPKSEASGIAGKHHRVTVVTKVEPAVEDWQAFWKGFKANRDADMLTKKLNSAAVKARWEEGKTVPGVGTFTNVTLSLNKL